MAFCDGKNCDKKEICMRWIEHYPKFKGEGYLSYVLIENTENCRLFRDNRGE